MEEERWERTRRVDLDVNYRSPGPDVPKGGNGGGEKGVTDRSWKERCRKGERGRKEDSRQHSQRQARLDGAELVALVVNKAVTLLSR